MATGKQITTATAVGPNPSAPQQSCFATSPVDSTPMAVAASTSPAEVAAPPGLDTESPLVVLLSQCVLDNFSWVTTITTLALSCLCLCCCAGYVCQAVLRGCRVVIVPVLTWVVWLGHVGVMAVQVV